MTTGWAISVKIVQSLQVLGIEFGCQVDLRRCRKLEREYPDRGSVEPRVGSDLE